MIVVGCVYSYLPSPTPKYDLVLPYYHQHLRFERKILFYQVFVTATIFLQVIVLIIFRNAISSEQLARKLSKFLLSEIFVLFLIAIILFRMTTFGQSTVHTYLFYSILIFSGLMKFFWSFFWKIIKSLWEKSVYARMRIWGIHYFDFVVPPIIFLMLYIPNTVQAASVIFRQEKFHHMDDFMYPAWAYLKGGLPNIDVYSEYGMGVSMVIAEFSRMLGGLNYENFISALVWLASFYFIIYYFFLRVWFRDAFLATLGVLLAFKCVMFEKLSGTYVGDVLIWRYPSSSVIRYLFDGAFFLLLLLHNRYHKRWLLIFALVINGMAIFYFTDTGIYLLLAAYSYIFVMALASFQWGLIARNLGKTLVWLFGCLLLPWVTFISILWFFVKSQVLMKPFWSNLVERISYISSLGFSETPIYYSLEQRYFAAFWIALLIPLSYVFSLLIIGSSYFTKNLKLKDVLIIPICIYGLALYTHYVNNPAPTVYFGTCIPFVSIVCYWLNKLLAREKYCRRKKIRLVLVVLIVASLVTNQRFWMYPHLWGYAKSLFLDGTVAAKSDYSLDEEDINLISKLTDPKEKVCIVSSRPLAFLIPSNRSPFFYYTLFYPDDLNELNYGGPRILTINQLKMTLQQLENSGPKYVFIEKRYFIYYYEMYLKHYQTPVELIVLLSYFHNHYKIYSQGQYLLALERVN